MRRRTQIASALVQRCARAGVVSCMIRSLRSGHTTTQDVVAAVIVLCSVGATAFFVGGFAHALKQFWVLALVISRICTD
jgi:hypothetical protein